MTNVRTCTNCGLLMWVKDEDIEVLDENTVRVKCPHCHELVRLKLVTQGSNAAGPKMGH
jgi:Zn finger protein HypA/HybF involved in hydrogenase expression